MTDFSQLPQLNSVAPLREEPWLRWPSRGAVARFGLVALSWFNVVMLSLCLLSYFQRFGMPGPRCGNQLPPSLESQSLFVAVNLGIWLSFSQLCPCPNQIARAKLPALVAVILWCGISGGIRVGQMLPVP
ncbi:MAG: hypothetical protein IAG10_05955 [Planctomycetaceae bacterium]|nr:hypothetical protein [Planctomycetaceae bacterium]